MSVQRRERVRVTDQVPSSKLEMFRWFAESRICCRGLWNRLIIGEEKEYFR